MHLREADEGDAAAVAALWTEAYATAGPEGRREPYALQEYFAVAASADVTVAVDDDGEVVGVAAVFPPGAPGRSVARPAEAEFARLAVAGGARRRGVGRALVEGATAGARGFGAEAFVLWSRPYQAAAHALYESLGWRRVPERDEDDRDGRRWVFVLDL
jgi:predicted N-acetyltransferase YhbS